MKQGFAILCVFTISCATADPVSQRLETTPRHDEWVQIPWGGRTLHAYVSYPEVAQKAPAVVVIHENRGLTDWVRTVVDRLSENGYIAIAPDMLSGMAPGGGRTSDFATQDAAREAISKLTTAQVMGDLNAATDYVKKLSASNGRVFVAGFCWGGARTWQLADARSDLSGAFVFYGTGPSDSSGIDGITGPVYGFYGGNDERVNATIPESRELMTAAGKTFEPVIYDGAGHAFMRLGEEPDATVANRKAREQAWQRWLDLLRRLS